MKIVYCENIDMFFSGEYKESFDLNFIMKGIGPDATIILTDPEHSRCEAVIHMREFCCSAINLEGFSRLDPDGLEIVDNGDTENMLYKPIHKDDPYLTFYAYDTKEKAEAAKERIREAIKFFNGGKLNAEHRMRI